MFHTHRRLCLGALLSFVPAVLAEAEPLFIELAGEVTTVVQGNDPPPADFPIKVGSPVSLLVVFDPNTPDLDPGDPSRGLYAAQSTSIEFDGYSYSTTTGAGLEFIDNGSFPQGNPRDGLAVFVDTDGSDPALGAPAPAPMLGPYSFMIMDEALTQFVLPPATFTGDALAQDLIDGFAGVLPPGNQQHVCFVLGDETVDVRFRLNFLTFAPVPEPGTAVLVAMVGGMLSVGRRRNG